VVNLGEQPFDFELLNGEQLQLISREGIAPVGNRIVLPGMSIAILMSSLEEIEDREVG
jgi:hypothetical protein